MAKKQPIKQTEARILVYLENADNLKRYAGAIAGKLDTDYGYILNTLRAMNEKGWIRKEQIAVKSHYFLTKYAPTEAAKEVLSQ